MVQGLHPKIFADPLDRDDWIVGIDSIVTGGLDLQVPFPTGSRGPRLPRLLRDLRSTKKLSKSD
jgi:hypothetical protein